MYVKVIVFMSKYALQTKVDKNGSLFYRKTLQCFESVTVKAKNKGRTMA